MKGEYRSSISDEMTPDEIRIFWNDPENAAAIEHECDRCGYTKKTCVESLRESIVKAIKK
jgi:DNA gyrase inhibitor GyrI